MRREATHGPGSKPLVLLAATLLASATAGAQGRQLPARYLPGDAAISAAAGDQSAPFIAAGAGTLLAVWTDHRANSTGGYEGETSSDIYGMRFDSAGAPLELVPFIVSGERAIQDTARISWNGTNWLVVYESHDRTGTCYYYQRSLQAVRVAPDGRVLDPTPIKFYGIAPTAGAWAVASDGVDWVIAGQGTSVGSEIVALRISADGAVLDVDPKLLVDGTYYMRSNFHLAHAGSVFLLTYDEMGTGSSGTSSVRFDPDLNLLDPVPFTLLDSPAHGLVSNGSEYYAVWHEQLPTFAMAVKGTRIDTLGNRLDGTGVEISGVNEPVAFTTTGVTWDGTDWKVTWGAATGLRIARVSPSGSVLDPGGVSVPGPETGLVASAGDGSLQLVWTEFASSNNDVFTAHVSPSNVAGANLTVSVGAPSQLPADVAAGAAGFMVLYRSAVSGAARILAQPLDAAGDPVTAEPVVLDAGTDADLPGAPAVAWNGSLYVATWPNRSGVVARRLQADGTLVDAAPVVVLSPGFGSVDVEALGGDFLVVGLRCGFTCQVIYPVAARVRGSDAVVLDPSPIAMGVSYASSPRLAALGGRWLVAWHDNYTHDDSGANTWATFIDAAGVKATDFVVHGPFSTAGGNGIFSLGLASNGSVALMVQSQELTSGVETDLVGRLIDPAGAVQPAFNLTPWVGNQYRPRVAWDGSRFVVVFQDQKARLSDFGLEQLDARSDLFGMRITPTGAIVDPQGFVFSNSTGAEAYPTAACLGGTTLIAGLVVRNDATNANHRIGYDLFGAGGNAWPVAVASASPSGAVVPVAIDFSSAGSTDLDGTVVAHAWDFGDGATSTDASPTHVYTSGGPHVATLTVTDDGGAASTQEVLVRAVAPNIPAVAVASSDVTAGPVPLSVIFHATGSYDADGFIGNIEWTFSDGGTYYGSPAYHTFYDEGVHEATLTVHDCGGSGTDGLIITAGTPLLPVPPSDLLAIAFTPDWINMTWADNSDNESGFKIERCQGTAAACDANPADFTEIARVGRDIAYHGDTGLPAGTTFSYRVRAFNVTGDSAYSNTSAATTLSSPPVAVVEASVLSGPAPLAVAFDGSGSSDPDGAIVAWDWTFGDGGRGSGAVVDHVYVDPGLYLASLVVTSDDGAQASDEVLVEVTAGGPPDESGETGFSGAMLLISKGTGSSLVLGWGGSCVATDDDFAVYSGSMGSFAGHVPVVCSTGGARTVTVAAAGGSSYYLVVPHNGTYEGRHGQSSTGAETSHGPSPCFPMAALSGCR